MIANSRHLFVLAASLAACGTWAQVPKEGPIDWSLCFGGNTQVISPTPQDSFGGYAVTGGVRATTGPADALSLECVGSFTYRNKVGKHLGYCVYQTAGGDKIFGSDSRGPQGYTWEILGGTGKFEGITGSGTAEIVGALLPIRPGTMQGCRRLIGNYKLP